MRKLILFLVFLVGLSVMVSSYDSKLDAKSLEDIRDFTFKKKQIHNNIGVPIILRKNITIATYNILNFGSAGVGRIEYFRPIIDELDPDILIVQEMNQWGVDIFFNQVMNYENEEYEMTPFIDGPDTDNLLFYKSNKIIYRSTEQIPTESRDI